MPNPRINFDDATMDLLRADVIASDGEISLSEVVRTAVEAYYAKPSSIVAETKIAEVSARLDEWVMANEITPNVDWGRFRELMNILNPEIHHCFQIDCPVDTWTGAVDVCPECTLEGENFGRRLQ